MVAVVESKAPLDMVAVPLPVLVVETKGEGLGLELGVPRALGVPLGEMEGLAPRVRLAVPEPETLGVGVAVEEGVAGGGATAGQGHASTVAWTCPRSERCSRAGADCTAGRCGG